MKRSSFYIFFFCSALLAGCAKSPTAPNSNSWVQVTAHAPFKARYGLSGTVFNNTMWVVGGAASDESASVTWWYGDVWSSGNGANWTQTVADGSAPFGQRYGSQLLSFQGKMWLIAGNQTGTFKNDVWSSSDGVSWAQVLSNGPPSATHFSAREDFGAVVFNNAMWVIGGWDGSTQNDVWNSPNGITWTQVSNGAFTRRWGLAATTYNNLIWIFGGANGGPSPLSAYSDVWNSPDGNSWTKVSNGNPFGELYYSQAVVQNNQIWLTAGQYFNWGPQDIVYTSNTGINWTAAFPKFGPRFYHLSLAFNNLVWIIGGMNNIGTRTYFNDVWHSP